MGNSPGHRGEAAIAGAGFPTQEVPELPEALRTAEMKEASRRADVFSVILAKRPDLDFYFTRLTQELTEIANCALLGQDVQVDLAQWMARTDKIEQVWLQEGTPGQSIFARKLKEHAPVPTIEAARYSALDQVLGERTASRAQQIDVSFRNNPAERRRLRQSDSDLRRLDAFRDMVEQRMMGEHSKDEAQVLKDAERQARAR